MKLSPTRLLILLVSLFLPFSSALPHHGRQGAIDVDNPLELTGIVTEFVYRFPHSFIILDVTDDDGNVVNWGIELSPPDRLSREGMTRRAMKPGDEVTITTMPAANGEPVGVADRGPQGFVNGEPMGGTGSPITEHAMARMARERRLSNEQ